jgi:hypothetical protein
MVETWAERAPFLRQSSAAAKATATATASLLPAGLESCPLTTTLQLLEACGVAGGVGAGWSLPHSSENPWRASQLVLDSRPGG